MKLIVLGIYINVIKVFLFNLINFKAPGETCVAVTFIIMQKYNFQLDNV
jgi:hypothetical protein